MNRFDQYVGKQVTKESGKPFRSGEKVGTVIEITTNPHTGLVAFRMDDGSVVDVHQCLADGIKIVRRGERFRAGGQQP